MSSISERKEVGDQTEPDSSVTGFSAQHERSDSVTADDVPKSSPSTDNISSMSAPSNDQSGATAEGQITPINGSAPTRKESLTVENGSQNSVASADSCTSPPAPFSPPEGFADAVAFACYEQFSRLPRRAQPQAGREWALLAGVLLSESPHDRPEPVALGTGSKCLGATQRGAGGEKVADSHAEVVARRAFRRFLMTEVRRVVMESGESRWLVRKEEGVAMKEGVRVHFFTSHTPCGDGSIFPREDGKEAEAEGEPVAKKPRLETDAKTDVVRDDVNPAEDNSDASEPITTSAAAGDIYRTGAKPVVGETADPLRPGAGYHVTGVLRTKPGRGERTLSMSCSDKLSRWLRLGLQGALLSCWLPQPLTLSSIVTGPCPYSDPAMRRALLARPGLLAEPLLLQVRREFEFNRRTVETAARELVKVVPSPCSVAWSKGCPREFEVVVDGVRQGVTKKARGTAAARVAICRREVMQEFVKLAKDVATEQLPACLRERVNELESLTYREVKSLAGPYAEQWETLRKDVFENWTVKPADLTEFRVSADDSGAGKS